MLIRILGAINMGFYLLVGLIFIISLNIFTFCVLKILSIKG